VADPNTRTAAWLLAIIAFLIAYGSLFPFRFAAVDGAGPVELLQRLSFAPTTRSDLAANVLLYLPLGASLAWLLATRLGGLASVIAAAAIGALMSLAIELAQLYETRRVASLTDFSCNTIGAAIGAFIALAIASTQRRLRGSPISRVLRHPVATALLLSWLGYRLAPFALTFDPGRWAAAFAPLAVGDWWSPAAIFQHALAWLVLIFAGERLAPGRARRFAAIAMLVVLAGRVLFAGMQLEPPEIAGMAVALAFGGLMLRLSVERAASVLAAALIVLIGIQGLSPFDFQLAPDRFALLPFGESLTHYRAANLPDLFLRCFSYGALVWLLAGSGISILLATMLGAGVVFAVELLQTWLPSHTADITDPLLAIAAGSLIAVFERHGGSR
jgi:VanZ family protein